MNKSGLLVLTLLFFSNCGYKIFREFDIMFALVGIFDGGLVDLLKFKYIPLYGIIDATVKVNKLYLP